MNNPTNNTSPQYMTVGKKFCFGGGLCVDHNGPVIASRECLFLVVAHTAGGTLGVGVAMAAGGLIGAVIGAVILGTVTGLTEAQKKTPTLIETDLSLLPIKVTQHQDWPIKKINKCRMVVVPRDAVTEIRRSMTGNLILETTSKRVRIYLDLFGRKEKLSFLTAVGWTS